MKKIESVFIVEPINQGWIIERLMRDISGELAARGVETAIGPGKQYGGQDVLFNSRYLAAKSSPVALVNSLFITHIDDRLKEVQLRSSFEEFNSLVCLSSQDAMVVAGLKGCLDGIVGIELPARNQHVRPLRLAMFSACYTDGRKNEVWLAEYFALREEHYRQSFVIALLGADWEPFSKQLADLDVNYEIYRYSRALPGEYDLYKQVLASMDVLFYLGFDGGAMSVYDGLNAGLRVIASDNSYHRGLDGSVRLFADREGFFAELDALHAERAMHRSHLNKRSIAVYVDRLLQHWNAVANPCSVSDVPVTGVKPLEVEQLEELRAARSRYHSLSGSRLRSAVIRFAQAFWWK